MKLEADQLGRLTSPELFPPGSIFSVQRQADGAIKLSPSNEDIPIVEPIMTKEGFLMLPVKLDSKVIAAAIRADRDAQ